jgi:hypothetical protein
MARKETQPMTTQKTKTQFQIKVGANSKPVVVTSDPTERVKIVKALLDAGYWVKAWKVEVLR